MKITAKNIKNNNCGNNITGLKNTSDSIKSYNEKDKLEKKKI
jgi:hypothetical protein